jgi:hypothetical protein
MTPQVRLTRKLYEEMQTDLRRPHAFAGERIGFTFGRLANAASDFLLIILVRYVPLADDRYVPDPAIGARFDGQAVQFAMQEIVTNDEGCFVVHMHEWRGQPGFSFTDRAELPPVARSFRNVGRQRPHGLFLLSDDSACAEVWIPGRKNPEPARINIVGFPTSIIPGRTDSSGRGF